uniref:NAC12 n=1 Tax=Haloxylon ammodendron TaxID=151230 RepID=A0A1X9PQ39_9CARY|nr:NAC12 [Haloxylon ammodendron]
MIMEGLLSGKLLMPGFRFHPSDEVLFMFYLKRKVLGKRFKCEMMAEVDVNQFAPWDLPAMSLLKTKDLCWYFFCPRAKKYPNGGRANRATGCGYWKSTGNDRSVKYNSKIVGRIKTLIFHTGKAPKGERTNWVMHEYKLEDSVVAEHGVSGDSYVICKIYEKSGLGPKNGEDYGAQFVEEEWESDDDCDNVQGGADGLALSELGQGCVGRSPDASGSALTSAAVASPDSVAPIATATIFTAASVGMAANADLLDDEIDILLSNFTEDHMENFGNIFDGLEDLHNFSTLKESGLNNLLIGLDDL